MIYLVGGKPAYLALARVWCLRHEDVVAEDGGSLRRTEVFIRQSKRKIIIGSRSTGQKERKFDSIKKFPKMGKLLSTNFSVLLAITGMET